VRFQNASTEKSIVRLGLIQWQMHSLSNLDVKLNFIDAVLRSDFALFPELFTALMADYKPFIRSRSY
jgi:hypothetical protein